MCLTFVFFFNYPAPTEIEPSCHTLSLHDALPVYPPGRAGPTDTDLRHCRDWADAGHNRPAQRVRDRSGARHAADRRDTGSRTCVASRGNRSEEHTSELQSLMRISYAVFCLNNKNIHIHINTIQNNKSKLDPIY